MGEILVLHVSLNVSQFDMNNEFRQLLDLLADLIAAEVYEQRSGLNEPAEENLSQVRQGSSKRSCAPVNANGVGKSGPPPIFPPDSQAQCRLGIAKRRRMDQKTLNKKEKNHGSN